MHIISFIEDRKVIRVILNHLGLWLVKSRPIPKAPAPPARNQDGSGQGDELRDYDERQALKMLKKGLEVLGINESELEAKAKGAVEKQVLAWWLRKKTVVSRRWISEKLGMGDLSRVTNAVRKVDSGKESEIRRWKMQLEGNS